MNKNDNLIDCVCLAVQLQTQAVRQMSARSKYASSLDECNERARYTNIIELWILSFEQLN